MTTKPISAQNPRMAPRATMVSVRLPVPLPRGLKVIYLEETGSYSLAATSRAGLRALLRLGMAGQL